jgi:GH35 family endo-1,4-beta-xylanase
MTTRRTFIKQSAIGAAALSAAPCLWAPTRVRTDQVFRPYPHALQEGVEWSYLTDELGDAFSAPVDVTAEGVVVAQSVDRPFTLNARWFVEGFGNVWLEADNDGEMYRPGELGAAGALNLNFEFARTKVAQNRDRLERYAGSPFGTETVELHALAEELLDDAATSTAERRAELADRSLLYGLWAGEMIELDKARSDLVRSPRVDPFYFGCETRQYIWAKSVDMVDRFVELFDYATITHYNYDTWYPVFEPYEGEHRWGIKDEILAWLKEHEITPEGRPLFWFHPWVMPDWLREKGYSELTDYVRRHAEALVGHYGDDVLHWEVVNEYHDWANEFGHTPDQITEITRLACETTGEVNASVSRLINNCCPFAEYAAQGNTASGPSDRPLRTPRRFMAELIEADVPFEVTGLQMYFPGRDLSAIVRLVERFAALGKPIYITETGAPSVPGEGMMYDWHRPWDQELQADWLEQVYTILYSKPYVHNISWYDFADFRTFIEGGGLIEMDGTRKLSFGRMESLLESWNRLPALRDRNVTGGPR